MTTQGNRLLRELAGLTLLFWGVFLCICLATYHAGDPSLNTLAPVREIRNSAGLVGSYVSGMLVDFFGLGAFVWPLLSFYLSIIIFFRRELLPWHRWLGMFMLLMATMTWANADWALDLVAVGEISGGGFLGLLSYTWGTFLLSPVGAALLWSFMTIVAMQLAFGISLAALCGASTGRLAGLWCRHREKMLGLPRRLSMLPAAFRDRLRTRREAAAKAKAEKAAARKKSETARASEGLKVQRSDAPDASDVLELDDGSGDEEAYAALERQVDGADAKPGGASHGTEDGEAPEDFAETVGELFTSDQGVRSLFDETASAEAAHDPYLDSLLGGRAGRKKLQPKVKSKAAAEQPEQDRDDGFDFLPEGAPLPDYPPTEFLSAGEPAEQHVDMLPLEVQAKSLIGCLADFGVGGEVARIVPGPVVTMFEFKPAPGVKLSRIVGLSDDLALALKAMAVRIEPIPGKDLVGIEIPNPKRQTVYLREVFDSDAFAKSRSKITLAIGKDIQGQPFAADLARMPHLLVAGATGAGKSVCLNGILLSLLYKASPDEVKLLLIDPKRIELSMYSDLPHLVHPVVTEMSMAKSALEWAVAEMERRYENMARLGARNIDGYNEKLAGLNRGKHPDLADLEAMPYLVLIIDELADLMMTAAKEAEQCIVRLAQLARAAGIHLILATQRPSVDVVTGLIKANFPTRISFQVTSKHDSRTILDTVGAEHLLGRGDMLYKPSGGRLMRMHGAFVHENEIERVVRFWKEKRPQRFELDFATWQQDGAAEGGEGAPGGLDDDPIYKEALDFVSSQGKASISLIQRRFRIGFNRAARYIEQMEIDGMLGPQEGSKPRAVIRRD